MNNSNQQAVTRLMTGLAILTIVLSGCAGQQEQEDDAIADFIVVSELEPLDAARFRQQFNYKQLNEDYVIVTSKDDYYLVEFRRRCRELNLDEITPDRRYERNKLRAGTDTIRGCPIHRIFAIDKGQAEELEFIGKGP